MTWKQDTKFLNNTIFIFKLKKLFTNNNIGSNISRQVITLFLSVMTFSVLAQYQNKIIETQDHAMFTYNWKMINDTLYSVGTSQDSNVTIEGWSYCHLKKYDENFNVIYERENVDSLYRNAIFHGLEEIDNYLYFIGTRSLVDSSEFNGVVTKIDLNGNLIWKKELYQNYDDFRINFMVSRDTLLYCLSNAANSASSFHGSVLSAIDTSGSIVWDLTFNNSINYCNSISTMYDNGLIMSLTTDANTYNKTNIYKIDSLGNIKWLRNLGESSQNHVAQSREMPNGNILAYGVSQDPTSSLWNNRAWLVELDGNDGSIIQDTAYYLHPYQSYFNIYSDPIFRDNEMIFLSTIQADGWNPYDEAVLVSIGYDYEINWARRYDNNELSIASYELIDLDNGFYLAAGIAESNPITNSNDEWILVVDSLGCDDAPCTVGVVENVVNETKVFSVYPNPTHGEITIQIEDQNLLNLNTLSFEIRDISGRVIDTEFFCINLKL